MAQSQYLDLGDHHGESPVKSFSWKPGNDPTGIGQTQVAQGDDLYLTRDFDGYSPILLQYNGSGIHFETAYLNVYKTWGNSPRLTVSYIMTSVYVTSYNSDGRSDGLEIKFAKLEIANYIYDPQGGRHKIGDPS